MYGRFINAAVCRHCYLNHFLDIKSFRQKNAFHKCTIRMCDFQKTGTRYSSLSRTLCYKLQELETMLPLSVSHILFQWCFNDNPDSRFWNERKVFVLFAYFLHMSATWVNLFGCTFPSFHKKTEKFFVSASQFQLSTNKRQIDVCRS